MKTLKNFESKESKLTLDLIIIAEVGPSRNTDFHFAGAGTGELPVVIAARRDHTQVHRIVALAAVRLLLEGHSRAVGLEAGRVIFVEQPIVHLQLAGRFEHETNQKQTDEQHSL